MTSPRVRRVDADRKDRGVQLEMPGGAELSPPGRGDPRGALPDAARRFPGPGGAPAPTAAQPARPPVILRFGPRDCSVLAFDRVEDGEPVYRVVKEKIKAASTAGVLARKLLAKGAGDEVTPGCQARRVPSACPGKPPS